jgi:hypothetical protein
MISGNIYLNSNTLTLGTSSNAPGLLNFSSGNLTGSGTFTRYISDASNIPIGDSKGLFPMGTGTQNRTIWIGGQPSAGNGGPISVQYNESEGLSSVTPAYMEPDTINLRYNASWAISTPGNILQGSSFLLRIEGNGIPGITNYADLNMSLSNSVAPGSYTVPAGSNTDPVVNRTGLSATNLNNTFFIASHASINPLPVNLLSFIAQINESAVTLNWETASEINNSYFDIERSLNGLDWTAMARSEGHGNSQVINRYGYIDQVAENLAGRNLYYRLKQVDDNGTFVYSTICVVHFSPNLSGNICWPNPAIDILNVNCNSDRNYPKSIFLQDMYGRTVYREVITGPEMTQINLSGVKPGTYFLHFQYGDREIIEKVIRE